MKKLVFIFSFLLFPTVCRAAIISVNTPSTYTDSTVTISSSVISALTGGKINCINNASLLSTTLSNMVIIDGALNGGTTIWQMISVPANTPVYPVTHGDENSSLCGGANSSLVVAISSGTKSINYSSFIRR